MSILQDPVRPLDPSSQQEFVEPGREAEAERGGPEPLGDQPLPRSSRPEPPREPGDDARAALRPRGPSGKTSFELASRGGYACTVTGTVAYLDEEAETYMVLGGDGELLRVPLRDITSTHETSMNEGDRLHSGHDTEGLGTKH
jgi:hypothetical protein